MSTIEQYPQFPPDEPCPRYIDIPDPAAGADINYPCPVSHRFKILGFHFVLTADANVANRNVDIVISQGLTQLFRWNCDLVHTAGLPYTYHLIPGQIQPIFTIGFTRWVPAGFPIHLFYGQTLFTDTDNIQAGDQFSVVRLYGFGWPDFVNNPPA